MALIKKKIVIVGDGLCGKSCLLHVFVKDEFSPTYFPTVMDTFQKIIEVDDKQVELELCEVSGLEDYDRLRPMSYRNTDVIIMCFSIDLSYLIDNIEHKWMPEVQKFMPNIPIILVCNKKELRTDACIIQNLRREKHEPLKPEDGMALAKKIKAFAYLECSAKIKDGVKQVFETAARAALEDKKKGGCVLS